MSELLSKALVKANDNYRLPNTKQLADYLLENGVVVPPVKAGDVVYVVQISRKEIVPVTIVGIEYNKAGVEMIGINELHFGHLSISLFPDNKYSFEWYKTQEEAEKRLETNEYGILSLSYL